MIVVQASRLHIIDNRGIVQARRLHHKIAPFLVPERGPHHNRDLIYSVGVLVPGSLEKPVHYQMLREHHDS